MKTSVPRSASAGSRYSITRRLSRLSSAARAVKPSAGLPKPLAEVVLEQIGEDAEEDVGADATLAEIVATWR